LTKARLLELADKEKPLIRRWSLEALVLLNIPYLYVA